LVSDDDLEVTNPENVNQTSHHSDNEENSESEEEGEEE
jgi:hypothetical protein